MNIFLYGTLCHPPLLERVSGVSVQRLRPVAARLADHAVFWAEDHGFPLIEAREGAVAEGVLLRDVGPEVKARLDFYELGFGYDLREVGVTLAAGGTAAALVYFPQPGLWTPGAAWSLDDWLRDWGPVTRHSAREVMRYFGHLDGAEVARRYKMILTRAVSNALAEGEEIPCALRADTPRDAVEVLREEDSHAGFFLLKTYHLRHPRFDGGQSAEMSREVFITGDASTVLPYDPARDRVMLIEQFRMGPFARGDRHPWVLEPIAGRIDGGEGAEQSARREAVEEAGLHLSGLEKIVSYYPTTGYCSEMLHAFLGLADLPDGVSGLGGVDQEHEDIRSHVIPFERAMELMQSGEINNGPLILSLLWLSRERERLRAGV